MPLMTLKNQINNPDGSKVNIEKTWSVDEMDEYLAIVKDSMDKLNALPEDTRQSILAFMEEMK